MDIIGAAVAKANDRHCFGELRGNRLVFDLIHAASIVFSSLADQRQKWFCAQKSVST